LADPAEEEQFQAVIELYPGMRIWN